MKKHLFGRAVRSLCFMLCLALCLGVAQNILAFQDYDGAYIVKNFYAQTENEIDVIHLGSSNVYANINPAVLWQQQGIASYNLATSMQTMPLSYYYLKEALKTQTPKLVVLDVFRVLEEYEYPYIGYSVKGVTGLHVSQNKVDAVNASFAEEQRQDYLLGFPASHNRYTELDENSFTHDLGEKTAESAKGYYIHTGCAAVAQTDVSGVTECAPLPAKAEEYLRKIIALTQQEGIALLLIKTPYGITEQEQMRYNTVAQIAQAQQVPFVNFNADYAAMGLDFAHDFSDYVHLNASGSEKFSRYYADYLAAHYTLPNHQGEQAYASYDEAVQAWQRGMHKEALAQVTSWQDYLALLQEQRYTAVFVSSYFDGDMAALQGYLGQFITPEQQFTGNACCVRAGESVAVWRENITACDAYHWAADTGDTTIFTVTQPEGACAPTVRYQQQEYNVPYDTVSVFVFDQERNELISAVCFDESLQLCKRMV